MPEVSPPHLRLTGRALLLAIILTALTNVWILKTELLTGSYATGGTPPATAIGWLLVLVGLTPLLGRLSRSLHLSRAEMLLIYAFLTLAIPMSGFGIVRAWLPHLTVLQYFATPENEFANLWLHLPAWQKVTAPELIRQCFEGADNERVPWAVWLPVLARWGLFFLAVWLVVFGLLTLIRRQWIERERLSFPLLYLPLQIAPAGKVETPGLFRNPLFWLGFGLSALHNGLNVLGAFNPTVPALGGVTDLGQIFTERPWNAIQPLRFHHFPQAIGLGYLVSLEISFSVWFFFFLNKLFAVGVRAWGYDKPGVPFMREQCAGGYLAMALILLWLARHQLRQVLGKALGGRRGVDDPEEPLSYREALGALIGGFAFLLVWCQMAGLTWRLAAPYLTIVFLYALVYARLRAEAGIPYSVIYPVDQPQEMLVNVLGGRGLARFGERGVVIFASLSWLSHHYYAEFMAAYGLDGLKLSDEARLRRRAFTWVLLLAMLTGFACACWVHLTAYYQYGENIVDGGSGFGDWRAQLALRKYESARRWLNQPLPTDWTRTGYTLAGFVLTLALTVTRFFVLRFPLHPLGYLIATAYRNECPLWGPFFVVWVLKSLILRLGGVRLYKQLIPTFLGLALGHFFCGGLVWGNITPFVPQDIARRYWIPRV
ncbi:MAG TPA: hypothetical protein EYP85_11105 [Armatimonadetes bacterium]|nr:hypothetical protein [Armatimonadota bacterium]